MPPQPAQHAAGTELPKAYKPSDHEERIRARWDATNAFHADPARVDRAASPTHTPGAKRPPYAVVIPPPNVTAALHLGHALNNTLQDVLVRAHRMMGYETIWLPGTDHAGIATQTVVEKRLLKEEGKRRTDYTRDEFVAKVQAFKDEYEAVITDQLKRMGCSCDWERQRFTMDDVCARAVREAFFRLFKDGLIYRGKRLVNWDPVTQTALADDEVEMEEVDGFFYYLKYPLCDASGAPLRVRLPDGDADHVTVATTRPETYLGDTAVAMNPKDPRWPALRDAKAHAKLPFVGRVVPILADDYVVLPAHMQSNPEEAAKDPKAQYATGFLKVTPAHDVNDYEIARRHATLPDRLEDSTWIEASDNQQLINVLAPDASISSKHGWTDVGDAALFVGLSREDARATIVKEFDKRGVLEGKKPYRHSVGHSYRSHAPIEPYLSDQWYVKVTDERLVGFAQRALDEHDLKFIPDRYSKTYSTWHENIRDWCISRQLWWGHRIPVWVVKPYRDPIITSDFRETITTLLHQLAINRDTNPNDFAIIASRLELHVAPRTLKAIELLEQLSEFVARHRNEPRFVWGASSVVSADPLHLPNAPSTENILNPAWRTIRVLEQDPDVLDTWFSSALWPLSTMGWPRSYSIKTHKLRGAFNPTDALCTAREIITLWVSRMVMFNRYFLGEERASRHQGIEASSREESERGDSQSLIPGPPPFRDVFIHAMIQDGEGRKMSKSLGNGVDPLDIIETHGADAMRYTLCHMTTQTQDVRMPVSRDAATGRNTSPKFDLGRNFCNKLWNAARFAASILEEAPQPDPLLKGEGARAPHPGTLPKGEGARAPHPGPLPLGEGEERPLVDRWMLSRLCAAVTDINASLRNYEFSAYAQSVYDLLWRDFCDWYLEAIKPTVRESAAQRAALRASLDCVLRLLHPICPFITEAVYERVRTLNALEVDGLTLPGADLLCLAPWPVVAGSLRDEGAERTFDRLRALISAVREARSLQNVPPKRKITLHLDDARAPDLCADVRAERVIVESLAGLGAIEFAAPGANVASTPFTFEGLELRLSDLADAADAGSERERLSKKLADLEKSIGALESRLNNPGYVDKAPAKLIEQSREQLRAAIAERDATAASLERLG